LFVATVDTVVSPNGVHTDRADDPVPSADGGRAQPGGDGTDDTDRATPDDDTGADRDADAELAELRTRVDALEAELERAEAEKRELVDRYERLLAVARRGAAEGEGERGARERAGNDAGGDAGVLGSLRSAAERLRNRLRG
jgi:hypothetical protein